MMDYIKWCKRLVFKRRVSKIKKALLPYGIIFRTNSIKGVSALCFQDDYLMQVGDDSAPPTSVTPTFSFPIYNSLQKMEAIELFSDFFYKLCKGRFPRTHFEYAYMREFQEITVHGAKNLLVPATPDKASMQHLKTALDKYLSTNV